ncbi:MAG: DUF6600 domain-containing protein [Verrucomicrobiia bacterium]
MKIHFFGKPTLEIALAMLWLASDHSAQLSNAQAQPAPPVAADASAVPPASVAPPPNILPTSPLAQVIRLTQAGVDESVILTYVTNSTSTFNLDPDEIIYLSDLGVPNEVVTAMMQRDQVLQQQMAAANPPPPVPETIPVEPAPPPEPTEVTVDYFYSSLAPYGNWVDVEGYGRCWRPTTVVYNSGWQPYCDHGHWVYSDCGWYWASDYSWGVTFHYGRWFNNPRLGWCWWPDTVWAPSWVTWRYSDDYCGWAPLPPFAVYRPGVGFVYHGSGVSIGFDFGLAVNCFTFVPTRYFCDPHPRRYRVGAGDETRIFNRATVINNFNFDSHSRTIVNSGIGVQHITDVTRTPIHPVPVRELRVSTGQPWRGGPAGQQYHGPSIMPANPPHPVSVYDNRNNFPPRGEMPAQNRVPQPANNQALQQNRDWPDDSQAQTRNYDGKHIASPRGQQFEEQTPHSIAPPPSEPVERPQQHNDSLPSVSEPQPRNLAPSGPTSSSASHSSQSSQSTQSSNASGGQNQGQNGRGH